MKIQSFKDLETIRQEYRKKLYYPDFTKVNIGLAPAAMPHEAIPMFTFVKSG